MSRFDYVQYDEQAVATQGEIKQKFVDVELSIAKLRDGNAKFDAIKKLEEAYMWCGKAIRDEQIARNDFAELQENRCNS